MKNKFFPNLASPITINGVTFKNRILGAPMSNPELDPDCHMRKEEIAFHENRARGGMASVAIGLGIVDPDGRTHTKEAKLYDVMSLPSLKEVTNAIHRHNCRAVMELAKKGHRRIAALTADPDDSSISQLRYSGYARALRELGIPPEEEDVICADDFTVESGCRAMRERLKRPADFTAVFAIADDMAIGAMRALRESGRSIPEDCSIIAIDGINVSEYIHPMLTTLCQPMTAMGTKSVELLLGVIRGGAHDHLTLPTTLRAGESVRDLTK